jgi:3-(3-hydroxy-phenyl)propionate hydroxylase
VDYVFHQTDLDHLMRGGLGRFEHVEVHLGEAAPPPTKLVDVARFVVACDGATSPTRAALGVDLLDRGYDEEWLVVDLVEHPGATLDLPGVIQQICDPDRLATYVPGHPPHHRFEFRLGPVDAPEPWALVAPWGFAPSIATMLRAAPYRFHALVASRWRVGPILLAGDAAHQMPPFMGQGMCSGVRDAANLAWKLAAVCAGEADEHLLDTYEKERRPHVEAVIEMSIGAGRLLATAAGELAAGRVPRFPPRAEPNPQRWSRLPAARW